MYPTQDQFSEFLATRPLDWIIDHHLFEGLPFYSSHKPELHDEMLSAISSGLPVARGDIRVVGSGRTGFSLSPERFGEPFSDFSDIDVIIVSSRIFDRSWLDILGRRRRPTPLSEETRSSLWAHRERHYVYNGWMYPGSVVEMLDIGPDWLRTFGSLSRITDLASRKINGRLYRTWDHARLYHRWSLGKLRDDQRA